MRVQELSLGFGRDLAGPVLWTEKHFEEEQNLLIGQGEELLTVNVPIHFRVRDAVAFARHTSNPQPALTALGYRQLLRITGEHTSFGLMTSDRAAVADQLRTGLQQASDQLGLGLEILFVGLKDVHPPVSVAGAYQDVVSAEEERLTHIDQARSYSVQSLGAAQVSAQLTRLHATTAAAERNARAAGETSRFLAPLATFRDHREVFSTRLHLEALEEALAQVRQLYFVPAGSGSRHNFVLGSDHATAAVPLLK
jgi:membrane protease subunit HflK